MQIAEVGVLEDHHSDGVVQGPKLSLPHQHPHSNPFLTILGALFSPSRASWTSPFCSNKSGLSPRETGGGTQLISPL